MGSRAIELFTAALLVPLLDQGVKALLRRHMGSRTVPLGPVGSIRLLKAHAWITRLGVRLDAVALFVLWGAAATALLVAGSWAPASSPFVGLLLGGSLSHAIETAASGGVTDYLCLRFWPPFDLADVAITAGAVGVVAHLAWLARGLA